MRRALPGLLLVACAVPTTAPPKGAQASPQPEHPEIPEDPPTPPSPASPELAQVLDRRGEMHAVLEVGDQRTCMTIRLGPREPGRAVLSAPGHDVLYADYTAAGNEIEWRGMSFVTPTGLGEAQCRSTSTVSGPEAAPMLDGAELFFDAQQCAAQRAKATTLPLRRPGSRAHVFGDWCWAVIAFTWANPVP